MKHYSESSSETISLSESDEEIHPNIDEKSYKNWKRQVRKQEKMKNKERLNVLLNKDNLTKEDIEERDLLINLLKAKYKTKNENSFRTSEIQVTDDDSTNTIIELINDPSIDNIINIFDRNYVNIQKLEDDILYNLSENIKEGNDELGLIFSRLSLLVGYLKTANRTILERLSYELKIPEKEKKFNEDILIYYQESKNAILNIQKEY